MCTACASRSSSEAPTSRRLRPGPTEVRVPPGQELRILRTPTVLTAACECGEFFARVECSRVDDGTRNRFRLGAQNNHRRHLRLGVGMPPLAGTSGGMRSEVR
jgi:hypothetical protein